MNRPVIAIIAHPEKLGGLLSLLDHSKLNVLLGSEVSDTRNVRLALVAFEGPDINPPASPWLAWEKTGDPAMISKAYHVGARAVFPQETSIDIIADAINRAVIELTQSGNASAVQKFVNCQRGEIILLDSHEVLSVQEGIVATTMIHHDGKDALLGMSGAGQIIVGHPDDACHIQLVAYTDSKVMIESWQTAIKHPGFPAKIKQRLQQMEGWSAMQARPSLAERVLGILGLLAGQFGYVHDKGIVIDVRITHVQLASAIGSTRTSITRVISELRDAGKIRIVSQNGEDRYCLCDENLVEKHEC